ncbi:MULTISPECIES: family 16 glycoside hydrolase [Acidobacteriaceae]|uniref:family 16 glycoside hydrolase n=1 Tax=Acidobacteriaceae TaxID=204434 RepID=UPI00131CC93C|nr:MULTISPECIES: family 16 glycoside hydrolase [Acidobacteriaceae]MDW5267363.1 family 16 glycoside hydrolase [Edaphobacter sp.]
MRPITRDTLLFVAAAILCYSLTVPIGHYLRSPARGLPYRDSFAASDNSEWSAYGGNWKVQAGVMVNESNERGAKLVTGSQYWRDYILEADIALNSSGDAGLISRVSDPEQGVDAYSGLYGGLRVRDQSLVFGVADHGWNEIVTKVLPYPIIPNTWYHLRMELKGCHVSIFANQDGKTNLVRLDEFLDRCPEQGKIGLRSYDSGGQWKNIRATNLQSLR